MPTPRRYRPRAQLSLLVPRGDAKPIAFNVSVSKARLVKNDHNHADTLDVTVDWIDTGVDPRWLSGAIGELFVWDDSTEHRGDDELRGAFGLDPVEREASEPSRADRRFAGRCVKASRSIQGDARSVEMTFHDYTSFFLIAKPVATSAIPVYADTLADAWRRLCESVPGTAALVDSLELRGLDTFPTIGSAVAARFRKQGQLSVKPGLDAWAVWQEAVGRCGLISFFDREKCIITTARDLYSADHPARISWGVNLHSVSEERNNDRAKKGIIISSFDPITGKTLEASFNPEAHNVVKISAKVRKKPHVVDHSKEYDAFAYPGITDASLLEALAERVYEERSRQEMQGTVETADMDALTAGGELIDLLSLGAGDAVEIRLLEDDDIDVAKDFGSDGERLDYLVGRGYSEPVEDIIIANLKEVTSKSNIFHIRTLTVELSTTQEGGTFRVSIDYCNRIDATAGGTAS